MLRKNYIELKIVDLLGRHVRTLIAEEKPPGAHKISWNGLDDNGNRITSGVYLYSLTAEDYTEMRKLLLVR
jgi:flagellar hook assembly protein FlgD